MVGGSKMFDRVPQAGGLQGLCLMRELVCLLQ